MGNERSDTQEAGHRGSIVTQARHFFRESVNELRKVTKPTRPEAMQATMVTIVIIVFVAVCVAVLDLIFNQLMGALLL